MTRSRIVALQAAVVGVLLVVVYLGILRPDDDDPLSGVNAPGGPERVETAPGERPESKPKPKPRPDRGEPRDAPRPTAVRDGTGAEAGVPGVGGSSTSPAPAATPTAPGAGGGGGGGGGDGGGAAPDPESPADDQYSDTLTRLTARLN